MQGVGLWAARRRCRACVWGVSGCAGRRAEACTTQRLPLPQVLRACVKHLKPAGRPACVWLLHGKVGGGGWRISQDQYGVLRGCVKGAGSKGNQRTSSPVAQYEAAVAKWRSQRTVASELDYPVLTSTSACACISTTCPLPRRPHATAA